MAAPNNLAEAFALRAGLHPEKPAVFWGEHEHTYGGLHADALRLAASLKSEFGIQPGDRVGLWLKNCPEFVPALFAIFQAGAVAVPINNFLKPAEILHILADAGIDVILTDAELGAHAAELTAARPSLRLWYVEQFAALREASAAHGPQPSNPVTRDDLAVIIYTSGTTGQAKGAMLTHGNLLHNVESCRIVLSAVDHDRFAVLLPMFHSFMLTVGILLPLTVGGSMVVIRSLHPPKNIIQEIYHRQATILPAVPSFFRTLAAAHAHLPPHWPLRLCISGGAALPAEILREFNRTMPARLIEGYGLSEASPVVSMNPIDGSGKEGSIGRAVTDVEISVQDDHGNLLPHGVTGEICVRGGNVMRGYWNQPAATAAALRGEWLLTGDVGHSDSDGYYFITDRKKDMLIVNGINVYPREIEEVLYHIPGVKEAAVIGVPDARRGEHPVAFVAANDGVQLDERQILHLIKEKLADYKLPKKIHFIAALPRNATGKVLKTVLRQQNAAIV